MASASGDGGTGRAHGALRVRGDVGGETARHEEPADHPEGGRDAERPGAVGHGGIDGAVGDEEERHEDDGPGGPLGEADRTEEHPAPEEIPRVDDRARGDEREQRARSGEHGLARGDPPHDRRDGDQPGDEADALRDRHGRRSGGQRHTGEVHEPLDRGADEGGRRDERPEAGRHREVGRPAPAEAGCGGDRGEGRDRDEGEAGPVPDQGAEPRGGAESRGAVGLHRHPDDADEGQRAGLLVARGGGDEDGADPEAAAARDEEGQRDERDHDGVAVGATDEVHDDEGVEHGEPEGVGRADAEALREPGKGPGQQRDGRESGQPHENRGEVGVVTGDRDDEVLHLQRERAVRRRRQHPHRVDLVGELTGHPVGAVGVRVESALHDETLGGVAVRVAAEERRGEQDREAPEDPGEAGDATAVPRAHPQPRVDEQGEPGQEQDRRGEPAGALSHPLQVEGLDERGPRRQERGGERAGADETHPERAAADHRVGPGELERGHEAGEPVREGGAHLVRACQTCRGRAHDTLLQHSRLLVAYLRCSSSSRRGSSLCTRLVVRKKNAERLPLDPRCCSSLCLRAVRPAHHARVVGTP